MKASASVGTFGVIAAAACVGALVLPAAGLAQPLASRIDGPPVYTELVPPPAVVASVRAAGFNPLSRPALRGTVYVVFAVDRYFMDVRVMVDGRTGRVISATRLADVLYGGPGYGAYEVVPGAPPGHLPPYDQPRIGARALPPGELAPGPGHAASEPPAEAPIDVAKRSTLPARAPLPRARPGEPAAGSATESATAAKEPAPPSEPKASAVPPAVPSPAATPAPAPMPTAAAAPPAPPPVMVPVAPLDSSAPAKPIPPPAPAKPAMVPVAPLE